MRITLLEVLYQIYFLRGSYCFVVWLLGARGQKGALSGAWHPGALPDGAAWSPQGEPLETPYGLGISLGAPKGARVVGW